MSKKVIKILGLVMLIILLIQGFCFADAIDPGFYYRGTPSGKPSLSVKHNYVDNKILITKWFIILIGIVVLLVVIASFLLLYYIKRKKEIEIKEKNLQNEEQKMDREVSNYEEKY